MLILFLSLLLPGCSVSKKIEKDLQTYSGQEQYFKGISVVDAETGESLIGFNEGRYFTPASNVKLFTLYSALRTLQDSIISFDYVRKNDSLILKGTANPLFLVDSLNTKSVTFLKNCKENIYLKDADIEEAVYGMGWSWDDYTYEYMPEKHLFPIYGNVVSVSKKGDSVNIIPDLFADKIQTTASPKVARGTDINEFYIDKSADFSDEKVPFKTSNQLVADLMSKELNRKVILLHNETNYDFMPFKEVPYDTLYTRMMVYSDNFMAEQLMLRVGSVAKGKYSVAEAIQFSMENYLTDIPQKPRWVDGSGLSRYNLFTPESMTYLLKKLYDELPVDQLFSFLPQGGESGTLKNHFKGQDYIRAKSGTLSNNYSLSGYLTSKKGRVLIFSYMNNHFPGSSLQRKTEVSVFLKRLYESY